METDNFFRRGRHYFVLGLFVLVSLAVLVRVLYLQQFTGDVLLAEGERHYQRTVPIAAMRGSLYDRHGSLLAVSVPVEDVYIDKALFDFTQSSNAKLAGVLEIPADTLKKRLQSGRDKSSLCVKYGLPSEQEKDLKTLKIPGLYLVNRYERYYPMKQAAAHVTGYMERNGGGIEGLEKSFDKELKGHEGRRVVRRSRHGQTIDVLNTSQSRAAEPGKDVFLSIDNRIQYRSYRALENALKTHDARMASAVVVDTKSGEVLAMVNLPSYNPNDRSRHLPRRVRNSALIDTYEPGSTIKPFVMAALLAGGYATPETTMDTAPGYRKVSGFMVRDIRNYGRLKLSEVITLSSNVGISRFAEQLPEKTLWKVLGQAGFGQIPGTGFPGEAIGKLPQQNAGSHQVDLIAASYGYGLSVSLLQLAYAYTAFANDGWQPYLTLLKNGSGNERRKVFDPSVSEQIRKVLRDVVSDKGTGKKARLKGYSAAGKTGTVRIYRKGKYQEKKFIAAFVGFAPASSPQLVVAVAIYEPTGEKHFGGDVAAPVFSEIMEQSLWLLGIPEDLPPQKKHSHTEVANAG